MYRNRFTSTTSTSTSPASGVYGSNKAGSLLKDGINGTDCLDILLIGDSNIARDSYGYTGGFARVLFDMLKAPEYATSLMPTGFSYLNNYETDYKAMLNSMTSPTAGTSLFVQIIRPNNPSTSGGSEAFRGISIVSDTHTVGTNKPKFANLEADLFNRYMSNYSNNAFISDHAIYTMPSLGYYNNSFDYGGAIGTISNWAMNNYRNLSLSYADFPYGFICVPTNNTYTSNPLAAPWGRNYIQLYSSSSLRGSGNTNLQYRLVHSLLDEQGGRFSLSHFNENTPANRVTSHTAASGTGYSTYRSAGFGTKAYDTKKLDCPANTVTGDVVKIGFDGLNFGSPIVGPFIGLFHSIIKKDRKGISISPFCATGGITTENIKNKMIYSSTVGDHPLNSILHAYLEEIINRQKENNNGSGKALIVIQSGINDQGFASNYAININSTIDIIIKVWTEVGGLKDNIGFLIIPTHPTVTDASNWIAGVKYRENIIKQIPTLLSLVEGKNTTIIDLEKCFNGIKALLQNYSVANKAVYYDAAGGDSHLRSTNFTNLTTYPLPTSPNWTQQPINGYDATVATIIDQLTNIV